MPPVMASTTVFTDGPVARRCSTVAVVLYHAGLWRPGRAECGAELGLWPPVGPSAYEVEPSVSSTRPPPALLDGASSGAGLQVDSARAGPPGFSVSEGGVPEDSDASAGLE